MFQTKILNKFHFARAFVVTLFYSFTSKLPAWAYTPSVLLGAPIIWQQIGVCNRLNIFVLRVCSICTTLECTRKRHTWPIKATVCFIQGLQQNPSTIYLSWFNFSPDPINFLYTKSAGKILHIPFTASHTWFAADVTSFLQIEPWQGNYACLDIY